MAQIVFADLARKAGSLANRPVLTGWLYTSAYFAAVKAVRTERRRQTHEEKAQLMNELLAAPAPDLDWEKLRPVLDAVMLELNETDREVVLLRYFDNRPHADIADRLGLSENAARMRVERALEKLHSSLSRRGVRTTAALSVIISANAVQVAPAGLAATLSTAALAGTTLATTATATVVKAIAMTTLQKTVIITALAAAAGAAIYEARQVSTLREQNQALQQQQTPLAEQLQQLLRANEDATRTVSSLRDDNERLNRNTSELLKLRGEVGALRNAARVPVPASLTDASMEAAAKSWLNRAHQLKQYVEQNPDGGIPEFQFLTDREWLIVSGDAGIETESFQKEADCKRVLQTMRFRAESRFGNRVQESLRKYGAANNEQFPNELSQLSPHCDPAVMDTLNTLYEIKPANILPENVRRDINVKFDWVITRKQRVNSNSTSRLAIFTYGDAYWQSPP